MFVAAAALFFALVCPLAATPMPVGKVKRVSVAPVVIPLPVVVFTPFPATSAGPVVARQVACVDIPDLICVRTC